MNHEEEISRINKEFEKEKIKLVQEISRLNGIVSINENKLKHERKMFQEQTEKLEFELASMIKKMIHVEEKTKEDMQKVQNLDKQYQQAL